MLATTNLSGHPESPKKAQFSPKRGLALNLSGLATLICRSKSPTPVAEVISELGILVGQHKTSFPRDIGPARRGEVIPMADKSLHELEIEFTQWKTQQTHIVQRVDQLHNDMSEVKKAVFQAKWMLVGALVVMGLMNSDAFVDFLIGFGAR